MAPSPVPDTNTSRRRHLTFWRIGCVIVLLGGLVAFAKFVRWVDKPTVRYAQMGCGYEQVYRTKGPVDVLFLGTSRMKYGVDPYTVARAIGRDPASTAVVNMGRPGRDTGQMYTQLVETERERGVTGPIVVEYSPSDAPVFTRDSSYYDYLPNYASVVTFRDILADWQSKPHEPAYSKVHDLLEMAVYKIDAGMETALANRGLVIQNLRTKTALEAGVQTCVDSARTPEDQLRRNPENAKLLRTRERNIAGRVGPGGSWRDLPDMTWDVSYVNQDRQAYYLEKIIRFGEDRGLPVFVVMFPGYLEPQPNPASVAAFERRFGVPLITTPLSLRDTLNADHGRFYRDRNHLNQRGWSIYTEWLVGKMRAAGWDPNAR